MSYRTCIWVVIAAIIKNKQGKTSQNRIRLLFHGFILLWLRNSRLRLSDSLATTAYFISWNNTIVSDVLLMHFPISLIEFIIDFLNILRMNHTRFNEFITSKLLGGAEDAIRRTGGNTDEVVLVWVPGAYEIPLAAQKLAESGKFDAVIALPVAFGILTTETIQQAVERAGTKAGNKGYDAAMSAIEMANLFKKL